MGKRDGHIVRLFIQSLFLCATTCEFQGCEYYFKLRKGFLFSLFLFGFIIAFIF
jgi:hypothetical protein